MLKDRKRLAEKTSQERQSRAEKIQDYAAFLRTLFDCGDWFVTITFRNRFKDSKIGSDQNIAKDKKEIKDKYRAKATPAQSITKLPPDPCIAAWEPDSQFRREPGPPVRDAALRELDHWLIELGWEAAGHSRQELFDRLADGLIERERRDFAKFISPKCLCCVFLDDPVTFSFYLDVRAVATNSIGWVIAEEFGRIGGRWHVHILIRGASHLKRKKWWRRAFRRFGRTRIEPIHD